MVYGSHGLGHDEMCKVVCESCGKNVDAEEKITVYGPDEVVNYEDKLAKRPHWFCTKACADKYKKEWEV